MAKILLKHEHLDNEGKLELLHMMSNVISRNEIGLHNAQGKIKVKCRSEVAGSTMSDTMS